MIHNDDAFTTMLLTVPITPDREELARPLSPSEFARLDALRSTQGRVLWAR